MITKEQLRDWLDSNERSERVKKLERRIDSEIKANALKGDTTFYISTGRVDNVIRHHAKTSFYDEWHNEDLSKESVKAIQEEVLKMYRDAGFDVSVVDVDCGWHSRYKALQFTDIHKALESESE